jgi:transposase
MVGNERGKHMSDANRQWFVGVDWASSKHDVSLSDDAGKVIGPRVFEHSGDGLVQMADWLARESGARPADIHVAIETPHGPLLERGFNVYSINPKQLDRFRDRFTVAGAKDDRRDADVLGSSLRTDRQAFRALVAADPEIVELREWSRMAEEHGRDLRRCLSRLREQLQRYFPAFLALGGDPDAAWKLALLEMCPTPAMARSLPRAKVARLVKAHGVRCHTADGLLAILRAQPPEVSQATVAAAEAHARALMKAIRLATEQLAEAKAELGRRTDALCEPEETEPGQTKQRDAAILHSSPGMGRIILATLLAEAPQAVRERDYHALRSHGGIAPVTRQSGKSRHVVRRHACNRRLQNVLYHWARIAIQKDARCRARYEALRARGHSWARALRTVADHLLYVACAMLVGLSMTDPRWRQSAPGLGFKCREQNGPAASEPAKRSVSLLHGPDP